MYEDILNNDTLYSNTNVRDSAKIAYHKLCDHGSSGFDLGFRTAKFTLALSKSRTLEPPGVFRLGGFFFWFH